MRRVLLATTLLFGLLLVASLGHAVLYPSDMTAWTVSELATILAVLSSYLLLNERT